MGKLGNLFPKDPRVMEDFIKQAEFLRQSADIFKAVSQNFACLKNSARQLVRIEHEADEIVHAVEVKLIRVFILKQLEKEDAKTIVDLLDDIIDGIEEAANRLVIFRLPSPTPELQKFAELITQAADSILRAMTLLRDGKYKAQDYGDCLKTIHKIENEGDKIHRETLEILNSETLDFRTMRKWEIVYQILENTLDKYKDLANTLERVRMKYS